MTSGRRIKRKESPFHLYIEHVSQARIFEKRIQSNRKKKKQALTFYDTIISLISAADIVSQGPQPQSHGPWNLTI
jgi:hypothetical protein